MTVGWRAPSSGSGSAAAMMLHRRVRRIPPEISILSEPMVSTDKSPSSPGFSVPLQVP